MQTPLKTIVDATVVKFESIAHKQWIDKPNPDKWSKLEILGHLCDSAYNNMRRFIISQYEQNNKIYYLQNEWVRIQHYQDMPVDDIILLWKFLNLQLNRIIETMPNELLSNTCDTGKESPNICTLEFLINDYVEHLNHHLHQILD